MNEADGPPETSDESPLGPEINPSIASVFETRDVPTDRPVETLDARDLPPPQPLRNTLERLPDLDPETVLVQRNDRAPQHLYPKLEDRGYAYETVDAEGETVTVIWRR